MSLEPEREERLAASGITHGGPAFTLAGTTRGA
jgi:hypothetical protein